MRKLDPKKLIVATHNNGKLKEIADLIGPFGFETQSAGKLGLPEPEETGTQFEENAYIKAFAAAKATGIPALSDDSGLAIDALDGAPGVYTADWAIQADGTRNFTIAMEKVEKALNDKSATTADKRKGRFVCILCVAWPDGHAEYFRGECEGTVIWPPKGELGFGYDPIFKPDGYDKTFGEMSAEEKHGWKPGDQYALSHRARAFKLFAEAMLS